MIDWFISKGLDHHPPMCWGVMNKFGSYRSRTDRYWQGSLAMMTWHGEFGDVNITPKTWWLARSIDFPLGFVAGNLNLMGFLLFEKMIEFCQIGETPEGWVPFDAWIQSSLFTYIFGLSAFPNRHHEPGFLHVWFGGSQVKPTHLPLLEGRQSNLMCVSQCFGRIKSNQSDLVPISHTMLQESYFLPKFNSEFTPEKLPGPKRKLLFFSTMIFQGVC